MIVVIFHGKYEFAFRLDASSILEAQFMVQGYINTQTHTPEYDFIIQLPNCKRILASHFEISMGNFDFYESEVYLKSLLLRVG